MGHADIQTTMIYIHHVPQHDAAERLSQLLKDQSQGASGCTPGARTPSEPDTETQETPDFQGEDDAGGGTRTPDTRIMIAPPALRANARDCAFGLRISDFQATCCASNPRESVACADPMLAPSSACSARHKPFGDDASGAPRSPSRRPT